MRTFRDIPIRRKLMFIIVGTTAAAMLLASIGILTFDSFLFRSNLELDLTALTSIIADNSTAALKFDDPPTAAETLNALRARNHLVAACIYRTNGTMLASYSRPGAPRACPSLDGREEFQYSGDDVTVSRAIMLDGSQIGTLMVRYDLGESSERKRLYGTTVVGVLLVSGLISFLLSSGLRALIANPISQLVRASTAVSETGNYGIRAQKTSNDEMGVLVERFNEMLSGIQTRDDNLNMALREKEEALRDVETAQERFRFMAESMPQMIFTASAKGEVDYFNPQWTEFTGIPVEKIGRRGWTQFLHPDDFGSSVALWRQSVASGEPFYSQHRFRRVDGVYRWHLSRVRAMRDANGNISLWIASHTDIHEQKLKEEELRHANEDLQQFAHSASHDLQEPVRNMTVYSEIIARRYHDALDAEGQQFLAFLREGGQRLTMLISDLLAYTRAGAPDGNATIPDTVGVLKHTLSSLAEAIRESNASVTYDQLPNVNMGETHLQQVFQNLISNALKYRTDHPPRIHISAVSLGTFQRFSVQDNGIGIDPQYKEKIFGIFKRLHRDQKYSGTGVGLAICQRVVERYGGRIWVESTPGRGATFFFTIPDVTPTAQPESADG